MTPAAHTAAARVERGRAVYRVLLDNEDLDPAEALRAAVLVGKAPTKAAARLGTDRRRLELVEALLEGTDAGDIGWETEAAELRRRVDALEAGLAADDRCRVCGHDLSDPVSVERGVGPDCYAKMRAAADGAATDTQEAPA